MKKMKYRIKPIIKLVNNNINSGKFQLPNKREVKISRALRTFSYWGVQCARCGLKGIKFIEEKVEGDKSKLTLVAKNGVMLTADHIIPLSKGGANHIDNLQPLCAPCNTRKDNKIDNNLEVSYSLRSVKEYVLLNYEDCKEEFVEDFHKTIFKLGADLKDFILRVPFNTIKMYLAYIDIKFGIKVPMEVIAKVPYRKG